MGRSDVSACAVCCCHCGIRFLTHRRNQGRCNLYCPFGCREHHRREGANRRSRKYNASEKGRRKKKQHNLRQQWAEQMAREKNAREGTEAVPPVAMEESATPTPVVVVAAPLAPDRPAEPSQEVTVSLDGYVLSELTLVRSKMWAYLTTIVKVIEGCQLTRTELVTWLRACIRQRSFDRRGHREYLLDYLNEHPPPEP